MIKKTFYNLPEEKRQRIIEAVMKEFSGSSADKVSINRIIKTADISRGSFYQYFDDKVDLVEILIGTFADMSIDRIYQALQSSNGDIFYTYIRLFDIITEFEKDESQRLILKNLLKNIKANDSLILDYLTNRFKGFEKLQKIEEYFNRDILKYKNDYDVKCLTQILTQILKNSIFNVFVSGKDCGKVRESYIRKIEIIKSGAIIKE